MTAHTPGRLPSHCRAVSPAPAVVAALSTAPPRSPPARLQRAPPGAPLPGAACWQRRWRGERRQQRRVGGQPPHGIRRQHGSAGGLLPLVCPPPADAHCEHRTSQLHTAHRPARAQLMPSWPPTTLASPTCPPPPAPSPLPLQFGAAAGAVMEPPSTFDLLTDIVTNLASARPRALPHIALACLCVCVCGGGGGKARREPWIPTAGSRGASPPAYFSRHFGLVLCARPPCCCR